MRALLVVLAVSLYAHLADAAPVRLVPDLAPAVDPGGGAGGDDSLAFVVTGAVGTVGATLAAGFLALTLAPPYGALVIVPVALLGIAGLQVTLGEAFGVPVTWKSALIGTGVGVALDVAVTWGLATFLSDPNAGEKSLVLLGLGFVVGTIVFGVTTPLVAASALAGAGAGSGSGGDLPPPVRPVEPLRTASREPSFTVAAFSF